jgi:hypothetical protein
MPRHFSKFASAGFGTCLLLLAVVFGISALGFSSPEPLGAGAPPDQFSSARARTELVHLLGDEAPHPIGSAANHLVKARLIERLTELGFAPQVQHAIGCSAKHPVCGRVENVLARIDGQQPTGILLMAHYDSVAYAPGAGDDGAGVATLLETARALRTGPIPRNSILFVFTDGEESGLLGAEAFFSQHPWAADVAVAINIEGSGSTGPSLLLRTGPDSGLVVDAFRAVAQHPVASSFSQELFKRMPNDTDFSVSSRFGKPGVDFAFAGERNHYHTPLDSIANLSPATLQHHGDNVLPLARALANADLSVVAPNDVYTTLAQTVWLHYPPAAGRVLAVLCIAALGLATWRRWQGLGHFSGAFGIVLLTLTLIVLLTAGALALADFIAGSRVAWPANPWPWRLIVYATPVVGVALLRPLVRRVGFWNTLLAAWWLWALLSLALAWYLPLATHVLLPAVVVAAIVIVALAFIRPLDSPSLRSSAAMLNAAIAGLFLFPLAYMGELTQGWVLAPAIYVPLALVAVTLLPLVDRGRVKAARWTATAAAIAGLVWLTWTPLYSEQRPQYVNFSYVLDADAMQASYHAWSPNPLPKRIAQAMPSVMTASPLPWSKTEEYVAPTTVLERAGVSIVQRASSGTTRSLQLRPGDATDMIGIAIPAPVTGIRIDGHAVPTDSESRDGYRIVRFVAPRPDAFTLEIDAGPEPLDIYLIDSSNHLPDGASGLTQARGKLAAPVHSGDRWVVYRRLTL